MSAYPIYKTPKGTIRRAYIAEAIGRYCSIDGGENNFKGKDGIIGEYVTAEEAIQAATREKSETCSVRVRCANNDGECPTIFQLD